jgi:hypothetical protein
MSAAAKADGQTSATVRRTRSYSHYVPSTLPSRARSTRTTNLSSGDRENVCAERCPLPRSGPPTPPAVPLGLSRSSNGRGRGASVGPHARARRAVFVDLECSMSRSAAESDFLGMIKRVRESPMDSPAALSIAQSDDDVAPPPFDLEVLPPTTTISGPAQHVVNVVRSRRASANTSPVPDMTLSALNVSTRSSRRSSESAASTPKESHLEIRNQRAVFEQATREADIARRNSVSDPKAVLARRWMETACLALSVDQWLHRLPAVVAKLNKEAHARQILATKFVPAYRAYRRRRGINAGIVLTRFITVWVARLRIRKRRLAVARIVSFLKHQTSVATRCFWGLRARVILIQRTFRRFLVRRRAQVELHLRLIRNEGRPSKSVEVDYWRAVGRRSGFVTKSSWYDAAVDATAIPQLPAAVLRRRLLAAISAASRQYHRDVLAWEHQSDFTSVQPGAAASELRKAKSNPSLRGGGVAKGRPTGQAGNGIALEQSGSFRLHLPIPCLHEVSPLATTSRSSGRDSPHALPPWRELDHSARSLWLAPPSSSRSISARRNSGGGTPAREGEQPTLQQAAMAGGSTSSAGFTSLAQLSRLRRPRYRALLTRETLFKALDEACLTTAALQSDPRWSGHLKAK